jgi:predicted nucleic acid-binding protein
MGLLDFIKGGEIYLDTNIFIYAVEGYEDFVTELKLLFTQFDNRNLRAFTSELTLAEVLVKPILDNNLDIQNIYENIIQDSAVLEVVKIHREILIESAKLRGEIKLRLPNTIYGATAIVQNCSDFLTNDKRFNMLPNINVIILSDYIN